MQDILLFLSSVAFILGPYLLWPSRYNVPVHINIAFVILAYFIPILILRDHNDFDPEIVDLYTRLLTVGSVCYVLGLYSGYITKPVKTNFSFEVLSIPQYEARVASITKWFISFGIIGMVLGYCMMGFIPMFTADPLAAKFFRNQYQVPFYTSIVYLSSFTILSTIIPISFMVWYTHKKKFFYLAATVIAVVLMGMSLSRGPAFTGLVYSGLIIMSFKSRSSFLIAMVTLVIIYVFSSVFYYIIGVRNVADIAGSFKPDHLLLRVISSGTLDVVDQLHFLEAFEANPIWTYGRTIYGGLIPSHYEWNPSVYTLKVLNPGEDVSNLVSGGLRLPASIWGYVSFQWPGVILFCFISGFFKGIIVRYLKTWIYKYNSLLLSAVVIFVTMNFFDPLSAFYIISIYLLPPAFILMFYLFRIRLKPNV
jgi:hypothetical protein